MDIDTRTALVNALVYAPFSTALPLPFRVILLGGSGLLAWATNLHFLYLLGIDTSFALDFRIADKSAFAHPATLHGPIYRLFVAYSAWAFTGWVFFRAVTAGGQDSLDGWKPVPTIVLIGILIAVFIPFNVLSLRERVAFRQAVKRCLLSPYSQPIFFSDVILADIFTSFAKVIGDLWLSTAMLLPSGSLKSLPVFEGLWEWAVPCMMSLPYAIRFRQCIVEYIGSGRKNPNSVANAIKYATAFPVIFLSAMQIIPEGYDDVDVGKSKWRRDNNLWRLWILSVAINSLYSFWWDVTNDWGLTLLRRPGMPLILLPPTPYSLSRPGTPLPSSPHLSPLAQSTFGRLHPATPPYGLRNQMLFPDTLMYYLAIALNLVLRCTWSLKLSAHLHSLAQLEHGIFIMEALEILRRWVWVFFRVEWEVVKKMRARDAAGYGPVATNDPDDIPMRASLRRSASPPGLLGVHTHGNGNGYLSS
ncbi:EXS-domain-containing protein [Auriculariales sp. MPI-PUGE-AT-0066]|nr:EXS-domain-containing protein [Auriculariales sp. MPI-PUGE-AT-0066]